MAKTFALHINRALWLGLTFVLVLTACSGTPPQTNNGSLNTTALEARQSPAAAAELPKVTEAAPVAMGYQPAEKSVVDMTVASSNPSVVAKSGALAASAGAAPAAAAPDQAAPQALPEAQAARANVQVDLSLPQEPKVGSRAPDFTLQTLDGETVSMADMIGRPVVISYWATWCVPCKQELPILQRLNEQYREKGLVVLTVNAIDQDQLADVQSQTAEMGLTAPVLLDSGSAFAQAYQAAFFPSTYFIDPAGVIRAIKLGDSTEADLTSKIQSLLDGTL